MQDSGAGSAMREDGGDGDVAELDDGDDEGPMSGARAAAHVVSALGTLTKGFTALSAAHVAPLLEQALEAALVAVEGFGESDELRAKTLMFLHRMVECLGERVLAFLGSAVRRLLPGADPRSVHEVVTFVNQVVVKFKGRAAHEVNGVLGTITKALFDAIGPQLPRAQPPGSPPVSEEARERALMLRYYYSFVHGLAHNGLTGVFVSEANRGDVDQFLSVILQGVVDAPDAQMQRQCIMVMQKLVECWAGDGGSAAGEAAGPGAGDGAGAAPVGRMPGFAQFALSRVAPAYVQALVHPYLNLKDASSLALLEALAAAQQSLHQVLGAPYAAFLQSTALPALGCSPELAASFLQHVAAAPPPSGRPTGFRDFLRDFAANYQSSRQQQY